MTRESLIEFPTAFPVKALGRDEPAFRTAVIEVIAAHAVFDPNLDVKVQSSSKGNFVSVTVTFQAQTQEQASQSQSQGGPALAIGARTS